MPSFAEQSRAAQSAQWKRSHERSPGSVADAPTWGQRVNPPGSGDSGNANVSGPTENDGSVFATLLTLVAVGGMFWWVTSGPRMARANPRERRPIVDESDDRSLFELQQEIVAELHRVELWTPDIRTGTTNQGHFLVTGHAPDGKRIGARSLHNTRLGKIAKKHGYYLDLASSTRDLEFGYANPEPRERPSRENPGYSASNPRKGT